MAKLTNWTAIDYSTLDTSFRYFRSQKVHDALWALGMQQKLDQFKGEDTGSAIVAQVRYESSEFNRVQRGTEDPLAYNGDIPVETFVEREALEINLALQLKLGKIWNKLLSDNNLSAYKHLFRDAFPVAPSDTFEEFTNLETSQLRKSLSSRALNGGNLYNERNRHCKCNGSFS